MVFTKGHTHWQHPNSVKTRFKKGTSVRVGMKHTPESIEKMRLSRSGKTTGANNPSWKGGITPLMNKIRRLSVYKLWQRRVFERDNYTCRKCGKRGGGTLTPHHLVSLSFLVEMLNVKTVQQATDADGLWSIRNGVTLCDPCHKDTSNYSWRAAKTPRDRALYPTLMLLLTVIFSFPITAAAATFGYTSAGASTDYIHRYTTDGPYLQMTASTLSEAGDVTKVTARVNGPTTCKYRAYIYIDAGADGDPDGLQGYTPESSSMSDSPQWLDATFSSSVELSAGTYYVGSSSSCGAPVHSYQYYDSSSGAGWRDTTWGYTKYSTPSDPIASGASLTRLNSIYATYTASEPEPPADTCTPTAGEQWNVNLADNCTFSTDIFHDAGMRCAGAGSVTVESGVTVRVASSTCPQITIKSGGKFVNGI